MSERIRGVLHNALYKWTYTLLDYFTLCIMYTDPKSALMSRVVEIPVSGISVVVVNSGRAGIDRCLYGADQLLNPPRQIIIVAWSFVDVRPHITGAAWSLPSVVDIYQPQLLQSTM